MSYTESLNLVIIINGVGIPTRILPGYIADHYTGALNIFIPLLFLNTIMIFSWLGVKTPLASTPLLFCMVSLQQDSRACFLWRWGV
jgi:hypothetical protein